MKIHRPEADFVVFHAFICVGSYLYAGLSHMDPSVTTLSRRHRTHLKDPPPSSVTATAAFLSAPLQALATTDLCAISRILSLEECF